ncbi:uncharacterized protein DDB_G0290301-like isoform X1 [Biomphalaria glabrata]|uniref:Uncharacterized protein DDB_G0290301-like isoform X1 n=2 Tax=Biomphalaria glabrata TaxID=6526 RepID=A0A9W2YL22_BIOGL|nr:uncharacterized protein DDB_G0290301-like isoform X1 [Biomphalaria glabrata]
MQRDKHLSLDDLFIPRNLWQRFEQLMVQQMFRLQTEDTAAQDSSSTCSTSSGETGSSETILNIPCMPSASQLQRNTNALCTMHIGQHPLVGLPNLARSMSPLLEALVFIMKDMQSSTSPTDALDAVDRSRQCKKVLSRVYKQSLNLESQLHQYINPGLVTSLQKRTVRATKQIDLISRLIKKLKKESSKRYYDHESFRRASEISAQLKSLLSQQRCEWQCVGRLKETLTMAKEITSILKFICKLTSLIERNADALRRMYEGPPPYDDANNVSSSIGTTDNLESSDATMEKLRSHSNTLPRLSQSEVTISLSLDYLHKPECQPRNVRKLKRCKKKNVEIDSTTSGAEFSKDHCNRRSKSQRRKHQSVRGSGIKQDIFNPSRSQHSIMRKHSSKSVHRHRQLYEPREKHRKKHSSSKHRRYVYHIRRPKKSSCSGHSHASNKCSVCTRSCCMQCHSHPSCKESNTKKKTCLKKHKKRASVLSDIDSSRGRVSDGKSDKEKCSPKKKKSKTKNKTRKESGKPCCCRLKQLDLVLDRCDNKKQNSAQNCSDGKFYMHTKQSGNSFDSRRPLLFSSSESNIEDDHPESHQTSQGELSSNNKYQNHKPKKSIKQEVNSSVEEDRSTGNSGVNSFTNSLEFCTSVSTEISCTDYLSSECDVSEISSKRANRQDSSKRANRHVNKPNVSKSESLSSSKLNRGPKSTQQTMSGISSSSSLPELQFSVTGQSKTRLNDDTSASYTESLLDSKETSLKTSQHTGTELHSGTLSEVSIGLSLSSKRSCIICNSVSSVSCVSNKSGRKDHGRKPSLHSARKSLRSAHHQDSHDAIRNKSTRKHFPRPGARTPSVSLSKVSIQFCSAKTQTLQRSVSSRSASKEFYLHDERQLAFVSEKPIRKSNIADRCSPQVSITLSHRQSTQTYQEESFPEKHLSHKALDPIDLAEDYSTQKQIKPLLSRPSKQSSAIEERPQEKQSLILSQRSPGHGFKIEGRQSVSLSRRSSKQSYNLEECLPEMQCVILSQRPSRHEIESFLPERHFIVSQRQSRQIEECSPERQSVPLSKESSRQSYESEECMIEKQSFVLSQRQSRQSYDLEEPSIERQSVFLSKQPSRQSYESEERSEERQSAMLSQRQSRLSHDIEECSTERQSIILSQRPSRQSYESEIQSQDRQSVILSLRPSRQSHDIEECSTERQSVILSHRPSRQSYESEIQSQERQSVILSKQPSKQSYESEEQSQERQSIILSQRQSRQSYESEIQSQDRQSVILSQRPSRQSYESEERSIERESVILSKRQSKPSYESEEPSIERQSVILSQRQSRQSYESEEQSQDRQSIILSQRQSRQSHNIEECSTERQSIILSKRPSKQSYESEERSTEKQSVISSKRPSRQSYESEECSPERESAILSKRPSKSYESEERSIERQSVILEKLPSRPSFESEERSIERQSVISSKRPSRQSFESEERSIERQSVISSKRPSRPSFESEERSIERQSVISSKRPSRQSFESEERSIERQSVISSKRPSRQSHENEEFSPERESVIISKRPSREIEEHSTERESIILKKDPSRDSNETDKYSPERDRQSFENHSPKKVSVIFLQPDSTLSEVEEQSLKRHSKVYSYNEFSPQKPLKGKYIGDEITLDDTYSHKKPSENQNATSSPSKKASKKAVTSLDQMTRRHSSPAFVSVESYRKSPKISPTATPKHRSPTATPKHRSPTATPKHRSPTATPKHRSPTATPKHRSPTATPKQSVEKTKEHSETSTHSLSNERNSSDDEESDDSTPEVKQEPEETPRRVPSSKTTSPKKKPTRVKSKKDAKYQSARSQRSSLIQNQMTPKNKTPERIRSPKAASSQTSVKRLKKQFVNDETMLTVNDETTASESLQEETDDEKGAKEGWYKHRWWWLLALLLLLALLYQIYCSYTSPACTRCTLPMPNIFFYPLNKIVNSARLVHFGPTPS